MYAIYNTKSDRFFKEISQQGIIEWAKNKEDAHPYKDWTSANDVLNGLNDAFRLSRCLQVVNLDNKQL